MKRITAFLLTALLLIAASVDTAFAADAAIVLAADDTVTADTVAGESVSVPITMSENAGYFYGCVTVGWDSDALELTGIDYTNLAPKESSAEPISNSGSYKVSFGDMMTTDPFEGTGTAFTLNFTITSTAAAGDYSITLSDADVTGADSSKLTVSLSDGKVSLSHSHSLTPYEATPADCETDGHEAYWECEGCGLLFSDAAGEDKDIITEPVAIPAINHKWDEGKVTKEATCTENGEMLFTCQNNAEHTRTEKIKPTGHTLTLVPAKAATAAKEGNKAYYTCSKCGACFRDKDGHKPISDRSEITIPPLSKTKAKAAAKPKKAKTAAKNKKKTNSGKVNTPKTAKPTTAPTETISNKSEYAVTQHRDTGRAPQTGTNFVFLWALAIFIAVLSITGVIIYIKKKKKQ